MHVLLIEPDKKLSEQYSDSLKLDGHDIRVAHTAESALEEIDNVRPDLIVLEIALKGHNGLEFLYEIKSYTDSDTIPVVLLTNIPESRITSDEAVITELGIKQVFYKPAITLISLRRLVMSYQNEAATK